MSFNVPEAWTERPPTVVAAARAMMFIAAALLVATGVVVVVTVLAWPESALLPSLPAGVAVVVEALGTAVPALLLAVHGRRLGRGQPRARTSSLMLAVVLVLFCLGPSRAVSAALVDAAASVGALRPRTTPLAPVWAAVVAAVFTLATLGLLITVIILLSQRAAAHYFERRRVAALPGGLQLLGPPPPETHMPPGWWPGAPSQMPPEGASGPVDQSPPP